MSDPTRPTTYVETPAALDAALERLSVARVLGLDTESNSFFAYRERTCLVQLSSAEEDVVIDPFAVDVGRLSTILSDPAIEKVLHAGELDVVQLHRDYGLRIHNLFDTQIAAKAVGRKRLGYGSVVEDLCGVVLAKDEQRSNWGQRPLTKKQLDYAFADTRYLLPVALALKAEVVARGPLVQEEVAVDCRRLADKESRPKETDPDAFERHGAARKLDPMSRQVLRSLVIAREKRAAALDKPLFRLVNDEALGELAVRKPLTAEAVGRVPGLTPVVLGKHGDWIFPAIREAMELGPLPFKRRNTGPFDPAEEERFDALRAWRKGVAEARGVDVDVIVGNAALKAIAKACPRTPEALAQVPEFDAFRHRLYGVSIVNTLLQLGPGHTPTLPGLGL